MAGARWFLALGLGLMAATSAACGMEPEEEDGRSSTSAAIGGGAGSVGLAIEVDDGDGAPLTLRAGQRFHLAQIDLRASVGASEDEGIDGLAESGDFAGMSWSGAAVRDADFLILPNPDGTFTRRRFYTGAAWMELPQVFLLWQEDADGHARGLPVLAVTGPASHPWPGETFFLRRMRAIQWTNDCPAPGDCTGASSFLEEALVELREPLAPKRAFRLHEETASLRLFWTQSGHVYTIPVTQDVDPPYAYGFSIDVEPIASDPPAQPDGSYLPGSAITFRVTLRDGDGARLHPEGSLPTYSDVQFGANPAGIQYYRAFFDPSSLYYRRKHRERMLMAEIVGPVQDARPIRSIIPIEALLDPAVDVQPIATIAQDGVFAQYRTFPTSYKLFGGLWDDPVPDTWTFTLPGDAPPGTYLVAAKGRRVYQGEDLAASVVVPIQVGTPDPTEADLDTRCSSCHHGDTSLGNVLHALSDRATCAGCHAPLPFELNAPVYVRLHFIHSRSSRYPASLARCASCHTTEDGIGRTSKSACLSCHDAYPADHVAQFGPVIDPYVGGAAESFDMCTTACHTTHPGSDL